MFQRGSSPIRLSQLNLQPAIDASAKLADSQAFLADSVNKSVLNFINKQEEKKQEQMSINALQDMFPKLDDKTAKEVYKDEIVREAFFAQQKALAEAASPTLEMLKFGDGNIAYSVGGDVINPDYVINPNAPASTAQGFEPEFPIPYMIPYNDGGTPDDPSDDTQATRVQVTTVSKDPGGLTYGDGTPVSGGDQVYTDPQTGAIKKLDATTMFPMSESGVKNLQARMDDDLKIHREVQEALPKLESYIDSRGQMNKAGAQRILDQIQSGLNAFTGEDLSITQRAQALGKAQFRQLLGTLRLDILGPGVLTEFDRKVIEEAIGGFGPFTTNEMAIEIVQNIANQKLQKGRIAAQDYNLKRSKAGPGTQYFYAPIDMGVYDIKPAFDPTRDLANDFKSVEEAEAFAKDNNGTIFLFNGKPFQVE